MVITYYLFLNSFLLSQEIIIVAEMLLSPEIWLSFFTLALLEIVLGIDNIIFIAILAGRLPVQEREKARKIGLLGAFLTRLALIGAIAWIVKLTEPLFSIMGKDLSGKSLILIAGGFFLVFKATKEIHHKLESAEEQTTQSTAMTTTFINIISQIVILDMVFSLDSIITAVGMTPYVSIMIAANAVALVLMLILGKGIADFIERHPSVKVLALSFLLMIGFVLVAEGWGAHIPKAYIYVAMGFSMFVELINIRTTRKTQPVHLNQPYQNLRTQK